MALGGKLGPPATQKRQEVLHPPLRNWWGNPLVRAALVGCAKPSLGGVLPPKRASCVSSLKEWEGTLLAASEK